MVFARLSEDGKNIAAQTGILFFVDVHFKREEVWELPEGSYLLWKKSMANIKSKYQY
ncbi:hypothetical protein CCP1ISM_780001 [Azospirillaceae bacterium]